MENKHQLGLKAKGMVTGFEGTLTGFCQHLTGCDQYLISPSVDREGKHVESRWYDVNRIQVLGGKKLELDTRKDKGAGEPAPRY